MKKIIIATVLALLFIVGAVVISGSESRIDTDSKNSNLGSSGGQVNNVSIVDGKQIIEIKTKGGYSPRKTVAKAGIPTVIRYITNGTFDCSIAIRIPSLSISKLLPATGNTDIDIGTPQVQSLRGTCSMGMYSFEIEFK